MEIFKQIQKWLSQNIPAVAQRFRDFRGSAPYKAPQMKAGNSGARPSIDIVKTKPMALLERYRLLEDHRQVEDVFKLIAEPLIQFCDELSFSSRPLGTHVTVLRELGKTDDKRSYLYMKPLNTSGILMERNGAGWRVSLAEKIIHRHVFVRSHQDPWDVVTVWVDPQGEGLIRLRSHRFSQDLLSVAEYDRRLKEALKDIFTHDLEH